MTPKAHNVIDEIPTKTNTFIPSDPADGADFESKYITLTKCL